MSDAAGQKPRCSFGILGPVRAVINGRELTLPGGKLRALLCVLLVRRNEFVSTSGLVTKLWEGAPPAGGIGTLRSYISQLRSILATAARSEDIPELLKTMTGGYLLSVDTGALDLDEFDRLTRLGRDAREDSQLEEAAGMLRKALALWRGPLLSDVRLEWLDQVVGPRLEGARLAVLAERIDLDIALGDHNEVTPELEELVRSHPFNERHYAQLMLALYRGGRQAEALDVYQRAWSTLKAEIGLAPGPELQALQRAILSRHEGLAAPIRRTIERGATANWPPRELPPVVGDFSGRRLIIERAEELVSGANDRQRPCPRPVVISGPSGVGKTALALEVAHSLSDRYEDGQIYWKFGDDEPTDGGEVAETFLRTLGVSSAEFRGGPNDRARCYRRSLDGRRLLVVLDGAPHHTTVEQLLPASPTCAMIVTTRDSLTGLEGAQHIRLFPFHVNEGVELLTKILGRRRVTDEEAAARRIVQLCDGLPLAVRLAGARACARHHWPLERIAKRLEDDFTRLDELVVNDRSITPVLKQWTRRCSAPALRLLASSARRGITTLDPAGAADFLGLHPDEANDYLYELAAQHLVKIQGPGVYRVSHLARSFALTSDSMTDPSYAAHSV